VTDLDSQRLVGASARDNVVPCDLIQPAFRSKAALRCFRHKSGYGAKSIAASVLVVVLLFVVSVCSV
jgi:hypothetical protein